MDTWAYPGLLDGGDIVTPAAVSPETAWEQSPRSGRFVPIFKMEWATDTVNVTQRLSSQVSTLVESRCAVDPFLYS